MVLLLEGPRPYEKDTRIDYHLYLNLMDCPGGTHLEWIGRLLQRFCQYLFYDSLSTIHGQLFILSV
jgi:hypothetical protein